MILLSGLFQSGCRKEYQYIPDPEKEVFNFTVTEAQRKYINESRGEQYEVTDPVPELHYAGSIYALDRFEIRGDNTLNFTRKGFGVNMDRKLTLIDPGSQLPKEYEEYKLLAMVYDYTYIENCTASRLFREAGLWPVTSFFTEVRLNSHTQGLYFFIEDPVEFFIEQKNASFVVRRGYDHVVKAFYVNPDSVHNADAYYDRLDRIYSTLPLYHGRQMYDTLLSYVDMEQYFAKLAVDMLIKNGDYTDEIFFYAKVRDGKDVLGVFPWDLDDVFAVQPHEIDNPWATGTVFGTREYYTMEDVMADVGSKLLYSIEDDLDYKIAKDDFIYQQYLVTLRKVIEKTDLNVIDDAFDYTMAHIGPFYSDDSIIAQSGYDVDETNYDLFTVNLAEKRQMIKERRNWILQKLDKQQNR